MVDIEAETATNLLSNPQKSKENLLLFKKIAALFPHQLISAIRQQPSRLIHLYIIAILSFLLPILINLHTHFHMLSIVYYLHKTDKIKVGSEEFNGIYISSLITLIIAIP